MKITDKDREIYDYIIKFALKENYLPSFREIGSGLGLYSTSTIASHMTRLEDAGYVRRVAEGSGRYEVKGLKYIFESEDGV